MTSARLLTTFPLRKAAVAATGFAVLACGFALIFLPGPAVLVIPLGLAILAKEFPWARRLLDRIKAPLAALAARVRHLLGMAPRRLGPAVR
jgi:hypothetical protein